MIIYFEYQGEKCVKTSKENIYKKKKKFKFLEIMNVIYNIYKILIY